MCQNKLQQLLIQKEHCKEDKCRIEIDLKDVEIFDTENEKGRKLLKKYGYIKYCDCIIFIKNEVLLVVEILCGALNEKELTDKEKQVSTWKMILQKEKIKFNIFCFIVYLKHSMKKIFFEKKKLSLRNKGILLEQFKRTKNPSIKLSELLQ